MQRVSESVYQAYLYYSIDVGKVFQLWPVDQWWNLVSGNNAGACPESSHEGKCLILHTTWNSIQPAFGTFNLKTKINVLGSMPGSDHKLSKVYLRSMIDKSNWSVVTINEREIQIKSGDQVIFERGTSDIKQGEKTWYENEWKNLNILLGSTSDIDVILSAGLSVITSWANTHYSSIELNFRYVPNTPPELSSVKIYVYNKQTGKPISGALVQILDEDTIVGEGKTGMDGYVTINGVPALPEGITYSLDVTYTGLFGNYTKYEGAITVTPGDNSFRVPMTPVTGGIPWNYIIIGAGIIIGGGVLYGLLGRKKKPPYQYPPYQQPIVLVSPPPYYPPQGGEKRV